MTLFIYLFLSYHSAVFPHVLIHIGIDLNVAAIGSQEQVEDMVPVELRHPAPPRAPNAAPLQLAVVIRIDAINKRFYFYLTCHNL